MHWSDACRNWADQYSSTRAAIKFLEVTMEVITNPDCWIVRLDVDELLDTGGLLLRQALGLRRQSAVGGRPLAGAVINCCKHDP
jgi:hypothetical protein